MLAETLIAETLIGTGAFATGGFVYAKSRRARLYRQLANRVADITRVRKPELTALASRSLPGFADRLAVVPDFLPAAVFAALAGEAERLAAPERSFVPAHKQGGTVAYETLIAEAPAIVACYHSRACATSSRTWSARPFNRRRSTTRARCRSWSTTSRATISAGTTITTSTVAGISRCCSPSTMRDSADGLSHAVLMARPPGREIAISTAPNTLVVFEGARVRHKVTPIREGERRIVLSMTYCTDPRSAWWQGCSRRLKDTAFFGVRALWT